MVSIVRSRQLAIMITIAAIVVALIVLLLGLVSVFQERIAFQPQKPPYPAVRNAVRVNYSAADGQPLFAYLIGTPSADHRLLIAFHGNADMAALQVDWAQEISRRTGAAVLVTEYRGYAGLPGKATYAGSRLDADAAYDFARSIGVPPDRIAFFGHSLGSAIATELATRQEPFALILESPFTSARDMAQGVVGRRPSEFMWNLVSRIHYNTIENVRDLNVPVFVVHGGQDSLIPPAMGQKVFQAAKQKGEWLLVPGASHNNISLRGGEPYWTWMTRSLSLP
ncbi:MAG TPA: alpha/beta hydrolase [Gemmatimonadaceae bacterium]|nr:alpha/beta hydrolase [Gemmatimonadaceae bacterium]